MQPIWRWLSMGAVAVLGIASANPGESSAPDPMATVPGQVAAAIYVQEWGQILWGLVTTQTGTREPYTGDLVLNDDGSVTQTSIAPDGTVVVKTEYPPGSFPDGWVQTRIEITLPNGTSQVMLESASEQDPDGLPIFTKIYRVTSSDGLIVDYTRVLDEGPTYENRCDNVDQYFGHSVLPDGVTQSFTATLASGLATIVSTQSDDSSFMLTVPLAQPDCFLPDFSQSSLGAYADPGITMEFSIRNTPSDVSRWGAMVCDLERGLVGTYALNADFSGVGQLEDSGELVGLISWSRLGEINAYALTGRNLQMAPSGAALDFLQHRWQTLAALQAPFQGIGLWGDPPHWRLRLRRPPLTPRGRPGSVRGRQVLPRAATSGAAPAPRPHAPPPARSAEGARGAATTGAR